MQGFHKFLFLMVLLFYILFDGNIPALAQATKAQIGKSPPKALPIVSSNQSNGALEIASSSVNGHCFLGWHRYYQKARLFISRDYAYMDNGMCLFLLSSREPHRLIAYLPEDNAYYETTPASWFSSQCRRLPYSFARVKLIEKTYLQGLACDKYACYDANGKHFVDFWATKSLNIDPGLIAGISEFWGVPANLGLPVKLTEVSGTGYLTQSNRPSQRSVPSSIFDLNSSASIEPTRPSITTRRDLTKPTDFAFISEYKPGTKKLIEMILPKNAKRAESLGALIYGEGGELTESSVDAMLRSPVTPRKREVKRKN